MYLSKNEYFMVPIELFNSMARHYFQTREVNLIEEGEEYEFIDFEEMFTEKAVTPFGKKIKKKAFSFANTSSDYYKDYFVSFNPEDNDGVIGGEEISTPDN